MSLWGHRSPGEFATVVRDEDVVGITIGEPDRVRTPPEMGRVELKVAGVHMQRCPCGGGHGAKTFTFEGSELRVSECLARGFLWWKP